MASSGYDSDEPLTPTGRMLLQGEATLVILCAMRMKNRIDVDAMKASIKASVITKHPRFCSIVVRDAQGVEHWRRTDIDIDRHFIVVDDPIGPTSNYNDGDDEAAVNEYLADLSIPSSGLDRSKPLWEFHILQAHKCIILRVHHALGDGISLVSMFLMLCRKVDDPDSLPTLGTSSSQKNDRRPSLSQVVVKFAVTVWFTFVYVLVFISRLLWVKDPKTVISGRDGVELWPRKLATARFRLDDMKLVKRAISGATINDVLFGVISAGLSRYLDQKRSGSDPMQHGMQITGLSMVNLRTQPGLQEFAKLMNENPNIRWGNQIGCVFLPLHYESGTEPLDHVAKAKKMLDRKKSSFEAAFSYWIIGFVMSWFGAHAAGYVNKCIICNTAFLISNVVGPHEPISYLGNPLMSLRTNVSGLPLALSMIMMSYAGRADLQISVAKDIIPDPEFLARCFEGALRDMKAKVLGGDLKGE